MLTVKTPIPTANSPILLQDSPDSRNDNFKPRSPSINPISIQDSPIFTHNFKNLINPVVSPVLVQDSPTNKYYSNKSIPPGFSPVLIQDSPVPLKNNNNSLPPVISPIIIKDSNTPQQNQIHPIQNITPVIVGADDSLVNVSTLTYISRGPESSPSNTTISIHSSFFDTDQEGGTDSDLSEVEELSRPGLVDAREAGKCKSLPEVSTVVDSSQQTSPTLLQTASVGEKNSNKISTINIKNENEILALNLDKLVDITKTLIQNKSKIKGNCLSSYLKQEFISNINKHKINHEKSILDTSGYLQTSNTSHLTLRDLPPRAGITRVPIRKRHPTITGLLRQTKTPIKTSIQSPRRKLALSGTKRRISYNT